MTHNPVLVSWSISPNPFKKRSDTSLGYRNFVLSDAFSELPIVEETRGANIVDSQVIIPQLEWAKERFGLNVYAVIAVSGLDSAKVLSYIIKDLKAKPYIARNLRREKDLPVSKTGNRICLAGFEMNILSIPGCTLSLSRAQIVLPILRCLVKISANRLLMVRQNLRKSMICVVDVKGSSPDCWIFVCKPEYQGA